MHRSRLRENEITTWRGFVRDPRSRRAKPEKGGVHQYAAPTRAAVQHRYRVSDESSPSLVAVAVGLPTIRTNPGNAVAGHPPEILIHAGLAHRETALAAGPAKGNSLPAAVTMADRRPTPTAVAGTRFFGHGSFFIGGGEFPRAKARDAEAQGRSCCLQKKMICPLPHRPNAGV